MPVAGHPGYFVTRDGRVFSARAQRFLTPRRSNRGYLRVNLGARCTRSVHRLIAEAFVPNPDNKPQVNHKDGDRANNVDTNLEWATGSENMKHAWRTGLQPLTERFIAIARTKALAMNKRKRHLTDAQASSIRERVCAGEKQNALAVEYGVSKMVISNIINRRSYTA